MSKYSCLKDTKDKVCRSHLHLLSLKTCDLYIGKIRTQFHSFRHAVIWTGWSVNVNREDVKSNVEAKWVTVVAELHRLELQ